MSHRVFLTPTVTMQVDVDVHLSKPHKLDPCGDHLVRILACLRGRYDTDCVGHCIGGCDIYACITGAGTEGSRSTVGGGIYW